LIAYLYPRFNYSKYIANRKITLTDLQVEYYHTKVLMSGTLLSKYTWQDSPWSNVAVSGIIMEGG